MDNLDISLERQSQLQTLALLVNQKLTEAGFPVAIYPDRVPSGGVSIYIDHLTFSDVEPPGAIYVRWHSSEDLGTSVSSAIRERRTDDPALKYHGTIHEVMRHSLLAILTAAGFASILTADDDDYIMAVQILSIDQAQSQ